MRKNRIMSIAIMVIVIVILTNFDKSAGKVVYKVFVFGWHFFRVFKEG